MKDFVNYDQALELKELGFNKPCFGWYENNELVTLSDCINPEDRIEFIKVGETSKRIPAPTFSQAFRFFREKYGYNCFVTKSILSDKWYYYREDLSNRKNDSEPELTDKYDTYEEAESAGLNKLIEICRKIKDNDDMISSDIVGY